MRQIDALSLTWCINGCSWWLLRGSLSLAFIHGWLGRARLASEEHGWAPCATSALACAEGIVCLGPSHGAIIALVLAKLLCAAGIASP